jgi:hypothetical protein
LRRLISLATRVGTAVCVALLALAVTRWGPVHAEPPFDVRALSVAPWALVFAVTAALTGRRRRSAPWRRVALFLLPAALGLALTVVTRAPAGLRATVADARTVVGHTAPGSVDVVGSDLRHFGIRRLALHWAGEVRLPESGQYHLRVEGRGRVRVSVGDWPVLEASGERFSRETEIALARGSEALDVRLEYRGRGARLRLSWTRPDGRAEVIPPRYLGPPLPGWSWILTDLLALAVAVLAGLLVFLAPWDEPRRLPLPGSVTGREIAVVSGGYLVLVSLMSWPLVRDLVHTGPLYRPDGRLNAWILAWAGHALWTDPTRVFQAPSFHPLPDTLAHSESLLLPAAVAAPFQVLGGPVLAYNLVFLASLLLSGLGVYLVVRRGGGDRLAAFAGGAFFAAGPHRWTRLPHIQAQVTAFLPFALLALDRFWERRTLRRALAVGLLVALQGLSSVYVGAITAAAVTVAVGVALFGGLRPRELGRLAVGFLLAAAILWPSARPYYRMRAFHGQEFRMGDVAAASATLPSYAASGTHLWGEVTKRHLQPGQATDVLFPGLVVLLLGIGGLAVAPRRYRAVGLALCVVAVVLSLGPATGLYRWLHEHVVLVRSVRVLTRFALIPFLVLGVLAGLALTGRRRVVVVLALGAMMVESSNLPLRLSRYEGPPPAARWLAGHDGAVVYVPMGDVDTRALLDGLAHLRPLMNGGGAFLPRPYDRALDLLGGQPFDDETLRFLRAVDVRHVVSGADLPLPVAAAFEDETVYAMPGGPAATVVQAGEPAPTVWDEDGVTVDLGRVREVSGLVFELGDGPWPKDPRVAVSLDGETWEEVQARASLADAALSLYRDPRHARGALRFAPQEARMLRIDRGLPVRHGALEVVSTEDGISSPPDVSAPAPR